MVDTLLFHDLLLIVLLWLGVIQHKRWARNRAATGPTPRQPAAPLRTDAQEPQPFPGLIHKPLCALCEQTPTPGSSAPRRQTPRPLDCTTQMTSCTLHPHVAPSSMGLVPMQFTLPSVKGYPRFLMRSPGGGVLGGALRRGQTRISLPRPLDSLPPTNR